MATKEDILDSIASMTVLELSELLKEFEEKFGVTAAAPVAVAAAPTAGGGGAEAVEEQDEFDVMLMAAGDKKIQVIKEVRALTSLGLKEANDLVAVQRDSFSAFLDAGLAETFRDITPIEDFTGQLRLELEFDPTDPDLRPPPKYSVEECKAKDMTYQAPIFVRARFMNATTGEIKEQTVFMGDFPMMTEAGTFIINGTERVVVSQLVRSPGVIFQQGRDAKTIATGTIHPYRGEWTGVDVEQKPGKDVTAGTRVARKRRLSLFVLLRALAYDEDAQPGL